MSSASSRTDLHEKKIGKFPLPSKETETKQKTWVWVWAFFVVGDLGKKEGNPKLYIPGQGKGDV